MKPVIQIVRVVHGSHLYGTDTPSSDRDYKGVHLPSGEAILLQRAEEVIDRGVTAKHAGKNTADAIDDQSFSLQKFFVMLMKGDTVATEILFAPVIEADPLWGLVQITGRQLLNRQCKGFVGYCVRQAAKYGIKGSRMGAVKKLVDLLDHYVPDFGTEKLGLIDHHLIAFAQAEQHSAWVNIAQPNGADLWHIDCCDRKMPMTASIREARDVYAKVWENYGARARAAMTNEGIDWKAVSHAVRVARQAIELLQTGRISFPRPDAAELLAIKQGRCEYGGVSVMLEELVAKVHSCSEISWLPEASDGAIADDLVRRLYQEQVIDG